MDTRKNQNILYRVGDQFDDEKFCFFAENGAEAEKLLRKWVSYHSHERSWYSIKEVREPKYENNIHNEYFY